MKKLSKRPYLVARKNVSGLIRLARADLEACEADPLYEINMNSWHMPNSHCAVCLAGSVMAKTLNVPWKWQLGIGSLDPFFSDLVARQLTALDYFRVGQSLTAWHHLGLPIEDFPDPIPPYQPDLKYYDENPEAFKKYLNDLADLFEAAGY